MIWDVLSVVSALVPLALVAGLVVGGVLLWRRRSGEGGVEHAAPGGAGQSVRRFFQYLLLLGLLVAAAAGVTGLLGRGLDRLDDAPTLVVDDSTLALQLALTIIATPIWLVLARWTHRRAVADPRELSSLGWAAYLTLAGLISLVTAMVGWTRTLWMLAGAEDYRGTSAALATVWTLVWAGHLWWGRRGTPRGHLLARDLLSALVGLATAASGLASLVAATVRLLTGLDGEPIVGGGTTSLLRAAAVLAVGAAAWTVHWLLDLVRGPRTTGWLALVLLAGVGGGLVTALSALSILLYDVLVWFVGDPGASSGGEHFASAPAQIGAVVAGLLVWWYHQAVLGAGWAGERSEVRRVYEYLMAAVGLLAAAGGLVMVLVTLVEAIAAGGDLVVGGGALNALLAALVLLVVGTPVWLWHWRLGQRARRVDPEGELRSVTRRTYLLILFGVMGVAAVVALITLAYLLLQDLLEGTFGLETMRRIRFTLGILVTTSLLSAYHGTVFRSDRQTAAEVLPAREARPLTAERRTLQVVADLPIEAVDELARRTGALVQLRRPAGRSTSPTTSPMAPQDVVGDIVLAASQGPPGDLLVLALDGEVRAIPLAPMHH
ncbi:DUF5671 domain-containing protein [Ornithinimicrobium tianjinense]|uniref:DUF5671 domain-containing protein n=1 Tax=Ornithinimicrobium tianjinense TaxID=1195761 RepID=A0A917BJP3_9MICO|nr:DUF5671 domain-containing protein [Ornithinimicrobium tianjinense]GGF45678.1 hypothetical protein GCM10011366_11770 [Ornithinimicrobium tianjinense]